MRTRKNYLNISNAIQQRKVNIGAVTNEILFKEQPNFSILPYLPYGKNNKYPNDMLQAVYNSPTAKGCVSRKKQFIFGKGVDKGSEIIVNREGQSLNDVLEKTCEIYSSMNGFCLHFNFGVFGQITEIQYVPLEYVRYHKNLQQVFFGKFNDVWGKKDALFNLYNPRLFKEQVQNQGGIKTYTGQIYYFKVTGEIYPLSSLHASHSSALFEESLQTYNYANIENGFSASGVFRVPQTMNGGQSVEDVEAKFKKIKGSGNAGSIIVVEAPVNAEGELENAKMFESFTIQNIDKLYVEQIANAEKNILKESRMPGILIGVSNEGMFNQESFEDAATYYNNETEADRKLIERAWMKFWGQTVFASQLDKIEIEPLTTVGPNPDQQQGKNNVSG